MNGEGISMYLRESRSEFKPLRPHYISDAKRPQTQKSQPRYKAIIGQSVELSKKRGTLNVKIDSNSIEHIEHDISTGAIPLKKEDLNNLMNYIKSASLEYNTKGDTKGKHKKKAGTYFYYYKFNYNGIDLYLNIESKPIVENKKQRRSVRLRNITKKIKKDSE